MSEYDIMIKEIRDMHQKTATILIPKAYDVLINEGLDPMSARDRIEKDLLDIFSKRTIRRNMPEEAKHVEKTRKNLITITNEGRQQERDSIHQATELKIRPITTLPITTVKPQQSKIRLTSELEIRDQVIPLKLSLYVDWDNKAINIDRIELVNNS